LGNVSSRSNHRFEEEVALGSLLIGEDNCVYHFWFLSLDDDSASAVSICVLVFSNNRDCFHLVGAFQEDCPLAGFGDSFKVDDMASVNLGFG